MTVPDQLDRFLASGKSVSMTDLITFTSIATASAVLTPMQLKAANTSPIMLVAAPGVGKALITVSSSYSLTYASPAYGGGTGSAGLYYGNASGSTSDGTPAGPVLTATSSVVSSFNAVVLSAMARANIENKPLVFSCTSALTNGNSSLAVSVNYMIINL